MSYPKRNKNTGYWEFCIELRINGVRKQIRRARLTSRKEALMLYECYQQEVKETKLGKPIFHRTEHFLLYWFETERKLQCEAVTLYNNNICLRKHILPHIGHILLQELTLADCQRIVQKMVERNYTYNTISRTASLLKLALDRAVIHRLIEENPAKSVCLPIKRKKEKKIWTANEVKHFLEKTRQDRFYCAYALALLTGLRMGEILGLRWQDINFLTQTLTVKQTVVNYGKAVKQGGKTQASSRQLVLSGQLTALLRVEKQKRDQFFEDKGLNSTEHDFVVFNMKNGKHVYPANLAKYFREAVKQCEVNPITFHGMRHTHATLLLEQNINIKQIATRLGHSKVSITLDMYTHVTDNMNQMIADKLDAMALISQL